MNQISGADASTLVLLAQAAQAAGEPIGQIETLKGSATVVRVDGTEVPAQIGGPVFQGDRIETAADGDVGLVFADATTFSLGPDGAMTIDEMVYDPSGGGGSAAISVLTGAFGFVSGQIAKLDAEAMTITTPAATIGIRGSSATGQAAPEGSRNTFVLIPDPDGTVGEIVVFNETGARVLNVPFSSTQISSQYVPPSQPVVLPESVVARVFGSVSAALTEARQNAGIADARPAARGPGANDQNTGAGGSERQAIQAATQAAKVASEAAFEQALASGASLGDALQAATGVAEQRAVQLQVWIEQGLVGQVDPSAIVSLTGATITQDSAPGARLGNPDGADGAPAPGPAAAEGGGPQNALVGGSANALGQTQADPLAVLAQAALQAQALAAQQAAAKAAAESAAKAAAAKAAAAATAAAAAAAAAAQQQTQQTETFDVNLTATSGNDTLVGDNADNTVTMTESDGEALGTLGGVDTFNANGGTDTLALENLANFTGVYMCSSEDFFYAFTNSPAHYGTLDGSSIEILQATARDGSTASVTLANQTGSYFVVMAGGNGSDTLTPFGEAFDLPPDRTPTGEVKNIIASVPETESDAAGAIVFGLAGNDTLNGSLKADWLLGGSGNDVLDGGGGNDQLYGGEGDDTLYGGSGNDTLSGGSGDDFLDGGAGADRVTGGDGADTFAFGSTSEYGDTITDFMAGTDYFYFDSLISEALAGNAFDYGDKTSSIWSETGLFKVTDTIDISSNASIAQALSGLQGLAGEQVLLLVGDGTNSKLLHWTNDEAAAPRADGTEFQLVAILEGVDHAQVGEDDFDNFWVPQ